MKTSQRPIKHISTYYKNVYNSTQNHYIVQVHEEDHYLGNCPMTLHTYSFETFLLLMSAEISLARSQFLQNITTPDVNRSKR